MSNVSFLQRRQEGVTSIYSLLPLLYDIIILLKYVYYIIKRMSVTYSESRRAQWYYLFRNIYWLPMLVRSVHPTIKQGKVRRVQAFTAWDDEKGKGSVLGTTGATQAMVILLFWRHHQCSNSLSRITYAEISHHLLQFIVMYDEQ